MTTDQLSKLIRSKSIYDPWYNDDPDLREAEWYRWLDTAEVRWLTVLVDLIEGLPSFSDEPWMKDIWSIPLSDIFVVITRNHPQAVVDRLVSLHRSKADPDVLIRIVSHVVCQVRAVYNIPRSWKAGVGTDQLEKLHEVIAQSPSSLASRDDDYLLYYVDALVGNARYDLQRELQQTRDMVDPSRSEVHMEIDKFVNVDEPLQVDQQANLM